MTLVKKLVGAAYGVHLGDQLALVCVPIVAVLVFDASPQLIGLLVACQSLAFLIGSLPFGILVDRYALKSLAIAATFLALTGFVGACISLLIKNTALFAITVTLAGFGSVLFVLALHSILPKSVQREDLTKVNALVEFPRSLASFAAPLAVGSFLSAATAIFFFGLAAIGALLATLFTATLPQFAKGAIKRTSILDQIYEGGVFVTKHPILRPIALCAVCWNFAFSAMLVVAVPWLATYALDPKTFGYAMSCFGLASLTGVWLAGWLSNKVPLNAILLFGPGSSVVACVALLIGAEFNPLITFYGFFFILGFGPSIWLVTQNSLRQKVAPSEMLGRVNSVIQTAVYGLRPVGALVGGLVVGAYGTSAGVMLVTAAMLLSFAASFFSNLRVLTTASLEPQ